MTKKKSAKDILDTLASLLGKASKKKRKHADQSETKVKGKKRRINHVKTVPVIIPSQQSAASNSQLIKLKQNHERLLDSRQKKHELEIEKHIIHGRNTAVKNSEKQAYDHHKLQLQEERKRAANDKKEERLRMKQQVANQLLAAKEARQQAIRNENAEKHQWNKEKKSKIKAKLWAKERVEMDDKNMPQVEIKIPTGKELAKEFKAREQRVKEEKEREEKQNFNVSMKADPESSFVINYYEPDEDMEVDLSIGKNRKSTGEELAGLAEKHWRYHSRDNTMGHGIYSEHPKYRNRLSVGDGIDYLQSMHPTIIC